MNKRIEALLTCKELASNDKYKRIIARLLDAGGSPDGEKLKVFIVGLHDAAVETGTIEGQGHRNALLYAFGIAYAMGYDRRVSEEGMIKFVVAEDDNSH